MTAVAKVNIDTVGDASTTPDTQQPWAELGLKADEYDRIREILGRRPTTAELAMYSVMWSEHCSYKSSKLYLRQFGDKTTEKMRKNLMVGMGENAGVVDVGQGWAVTFKIESHNHPSYIEPFQGAATGVGGIVRDIISMGARPVAVMDALRFGAIDDPDTARVVHGVVAGISFYGNCLGLPNIGGETWFDSVYQANPLVNALAVGVLRHEDLHLANARGVGNKVVLFGARTGGDGIGGASILASDSFSAGGPTKRPAVQVGDPFAEKVLIECCLELFQQELDRVHRGALPHDDEEGRERADEQRHDEPGESRSILLLREAGIHEGEPSTAVESESGLVHAAQTSSQGDTRHRAKQTQPWRPGGFPLPLPFPVPVTGPVVGSGVGVGVGGGGR
mgnify:CR=1 FL=1